MKKNEIAEMAEGLARARREAEAAWSKQTPRQRRPSLASALRQAKKEGRAVSGATWAADGSVSLTFGEPNPAQQADLDKWMAKRAH